MQKQEKSFLICWQRRQFETSSINMACYSRWELDRGKRMCYWKKNIILQGWQRSQSKSKEKKDSKDIHSSRLGNGNLKNMREASSYDLMKETIHRCWVNGTNSTASARQKLVKTCGTGKDPAVWPKPGPEPEVSHSATVTSCALCPPKVALAPPSMPAPAFLSPVALIQPGANSEQLDHPLENSSIHCRQDH